MLSLKPFNNSTVFKILQVGLPKILQKVAKSDRARGFLALLGQQALPSNLILGETMHNYVL